MSAPDEDLDPNTESVIADSSENSEETLDQPLKAAAVPGGSDPPGPHGPLLPSTE